MLEISENYFKAIIIKMIEQAITNYLKQMKTKKKEHFSKEIEGIKKNQMKVIEVKNAITKIKNSLMGSKVE